MFVDIKTTENKYSIIYLDPPWKYGGGGSCRGWAANVYYPTMTDDEIVDLLKESIDRISEKDCLMFMWATGPHLKNQINVGERLGFKYITVGFVWHKKHSNVGNYTMSSCEFVLIFKKGRIPSDRVRNPGTAQFLSELSQSHSVKPQEIRDRICQMFPISKKIELFARKSSEGFDYWGNTENDNVYKKLKLEEKL